jgi:glutathione S-transferase
MSDPAARLITIPPNTDCETGRWLLDHYGVPYREQRHTPFFIFGVLRKAADTNLYPLYQASDLTIPSWQAMYKHFEAEADADTRLMPEDAAAAEALQARINKYYLLFGEEAPKWAFYYLLTKRRMTDAAFAFGVPWYERALINGLFFSVRVVMIRGLHTGLDTAEAAIPKLQAAYDELDALLADGRPYLDGDRFTLFDLVVCANAGLTVMPAEYGAPLPALQSLPEEVAATVEAFRERPTGQYLLRTFAERRRPPTL